MNRKKLLSNPTTQFNNRDTHGLKIFLGSNSLSTGFYISSGGRDIGLSSCSGMIILLRLAGADDHVNDDDL
jgi:hypothetical protein